jgi:hypothetical protein
MHYVVAIALLYLAIAITVVVYRTPGYRSVQQTISELGARGAIHEKFVAYGIFFPVGLALATVAFYTRSNEAAAMLAGVLAVGYIGSAFFPIDPDAPAIGSLSNTIHGLIGGIQYIGAIAAIEIHARDLGFPFTLAKFAIIGFLVIHYIPYLREVRGIYQRFVETGLFGILIFFIVAFGPVT